MKNVSILWKKYYLKENPHPNKNQTKKGNIRRQTTLEETNNCKPADIYMKKQELLPSLSMRGNDIVQKSASKVHHSVNEETQSTHKCNKTSKTSYASFHPATTAIFHNYCDQCYFHGSLTHALEYSSSLHSGVLLPLIPFFIKYH